MFNGVDGMTRVLDVTDREEGGHVALICLTVAGVMRRGWDGQSVLIVFKAPSSGKKIKGDLWF